MPKVGDIFYRFDTDYGSKMSFDFGFPKRKRIFRNIQLIRAIVVRITPKGCVVQPHWGKLNKITAKHVGMREHFILEGRGKRWAYPDKLRAAQSFMFRKRKQLGILADKIVITQLAWQESLDLYLKLQGDSDEQKTSSDFGEFGYTQIYQRSKRQKDSPYCGCWCERTSYRGQVPKTKNTHCIFEAYQQRDKLTLQYPSALLRAVAGWRTQNTTFE